MGPARRGIDTRLAKGTGVSHHPGPGRGLYANGNRVTITENDGLVTANAYDAKGRLISEMRTGPSAYSSQYFYDLNDLLMARDLPGSGRVTFTLDNASRITGDSAGTAYSYNANGWLLGRSGGIGNLSLGYHYAGRVVNMTLGGGTTSLQYAYDGDGRLQRLRRNNMLSSFLFDGRDVLREWLPLTMSTSTNAGIPSGLVAPNPRDLPRLQAVAPASSSASTQTYMDYVHGLGLLPEWVTTMVNSAETETSDFFCCHSQRSSESRCVRSDHNGRYSYSLVTYDEPRVRLGARQVRRVQWPQELHPSSPALMILPGAGEYRDRGSDTGDRTGQGQAAGQWR